LTNKLLKYIHTTKYLKPTQIYHQLKKRILTPSVDSEIDPDICIRKPEGWIDVSLARQSMIGAYSFRFLNMEFDISKHGWNDEEIDLLWRYNLHYFDDLNSVNANERKELHEALIKKWINDNPPGSKVAWDSYPLSLRIVNWIKWQYRNDALTKEAIQSLYLQARYLFSSIEWHLLGNHLFANAKALLFAGFFFDTEEAMQWRIKAVEILITEIDEQILSDGGHFERSPMYHSVILGDVLDIINLLGAYTASIGIREAVLLNSVKKTVHKMFRFLDLMCHPDGEISFFNDAALGIAPLPVQLRDYASNLGLKIGNETHNGLIHLEESGYIRINNNVCSMILDVAPVGPDYIPGHAHADTLSFEMSVFGQRLIVNSGTSTYRSGKERDWERSTSAHSTVVVNGADSSEVWGGFRVARRARPFNLRINQAEDMFDISCSHDGYRRIGKDIVHRRRWTVGESEVVVRDEVEGGFDEAKAYFYFHPEIEFSWVDENKGVLSIQNSKSISVLVEEGSGNVQSAKYYSEFGRAVDTTCLIINLENAKSCLRFFW
jgi:uncharacterized heparinase superfamily protein